MWTVFMSIKTCVFVTKLATLSLIDNSASLQVIIAYKYLDEVKRHRHDRQSEDNVDSCSYHFQVLCSRSEALTAWYQVTKTDGGDGDEAIVG